MIVIDTWVLLVLFGIMLLIFIVISSILAYHWHRFGFDRERIAVMRVIYFIGCLIFLGAALTGIVLYGLSS